MKIANVQVYEACDRSEFVEVSDAEIEELRKWKAYPYKGKTEAELAAYVAGIADKIDEDDDSADTPKIAISLRVSFWGGDVSRTEMWNSRDNRNDSKITVFDDDERELGSAESSI